MAEERRDNTIFKLGILIALALIFYGLWVEENPTVVEIVELVTNKTVEFLDPKVVTRVNKEVVHLTATPGAGVNDVIYSTPASFGVDQAAIAVGQVDEVATVIASVPATLRALTPIAPSPTPEPTQTPAPKATMYLPPAESTLGPMPAELAPPTVAPPTVAPPTVVPPTVVPPTVVPPTVVPPTVVPPTVVPPTVVPPTVVPPTVVPPTEAPQALAPITPVPEEEPELITLQLTDEKTNPEQPQPPSGVATVQGNISSEEELTLILTNGDYYNSFQVGSDGEFWFEGVPNGSYNLSANPGGAGAQCAEITVSVPEGHATLTYNYRYYKRQCTSN